MGSATISASWLSAEEYDLHQLITAWTARPNFEDAPELRWLNVDEDRATLHLTEVQASAQLARHRPNCLPHSDSASARRDEKILAAGTADDRRMAKAATLSAARIGCVRHNAMTFVRHDLMARRPTARHAQDARRTLNAYLDDTRSADAALELIQQISQPRIWLFAVQLADALLAFEDTTNRRFLFQHDHGARSSSEPTERNRTMHAFPERHRAKPDPVKRTHRRHALCASG